MDTRALLEGLTADQAEAVAAPGATLCILAGAGSGKTRVLTRRVAHRIATGAADAEHVLAITFTKKAARQLATRVARLGVRDRVRTATFHSAALTALRQHWDDAQVTPPSLLERKGPVLAKVLPSGVDATVADVAAEIEWAKARLVAPEGYETAVRSSGRRPPLPVGAMATVYGDYEARKRAGRLVDFDDLLLECAALFARNPGFAAKERWRTRHLFVDELQDVNPAQWALLEGWLGERDDISVVGDPHQAIYSWNGADPGYLTSFRRRFPDATVVTLNDNFRSTAQILTVADAVLCSGGGGGDRPARPLRPTRDDGPVPTVRSYATDRDEAVGIARGVRDRHRPGGWWSDLAVLARTHAQLVVVEEALRAAGVPCRVRGAGAFLDRPEVREALGSLVRNAAGFTHWLEELDERVGAEGVGVDGPAEERRATLVELVRLGREFAGSEAAVSAAGFRAWLAVALRGEGTSPDADAVELATFHAAKGLEWPVVFLAGLEQGLVPIGRARDDASVDEERRLLYVAVTRAERELHCSWSRTRRFGSRSVRREPSPWLADVEAARAALSSSVPPLDERRGRVAAERQRLRATPDRDRGPQVGGAADPAVLTALKNWRSTAARAAGVPAHVIFHDTTLAAVAEARPRDRDSLLALPGLGPVKADRYGEALLDVVASLAS